MMDRPGLPARAADELDQRFHIAAGLRRQINKVFPNHWSFMLGEIALYSFIALLLSGTYLALYFDPSLAEVRYQGSFVPLRGIRNVQGLREHAGPVVRRARRAVHPSDPPLGRAGVRRGDDSAHVRTFFTGAFRKPRETTWALGVGLLILGILEGFIGYSLPDDLLSGTGLRIGSGIVLSIPVIGTWLH
jgi:ubiquinol-cytochrome c reductase cytochrome b subunit